MPPLGGKCSGICIGRGGVGEGKATQSLQATPYSNALFGNPSDLQLYTHLGSYNHLVQQLFSDVLLANRSVPEVPAGATRWPRLGILVVVAGCVLFELTSCLAPPLSCRPTASCRLARASYWRPRALCSPATFFSGRLALQLLCAIA